ncbi:hypothetical protein EVAR_16072_1 [Eumeta japonica]|uniref:Uncharacterized protein n=1 Tax=Eumeta variegata TaxID=151549 RepID=A0A4C1UIC4_EUMVA|nr:hypothetical protein EVAR_16072_1 [Eumeta japonica]
MMKELVDAGIRPVKLYTSWIIILDASSKNVADRAAIFQTRKIVYLTFSIERLLYQVVIVLLTTVISSFQPALGEPKGLEIQICHLSNKIEGGLASAVSTDLLRSAQGKKPFAVSLRSCGVNSVRLTNYEEHAPQLPESTRGRTLCLKISFYHSAL